jgi:hypothetical protein
MFKFDYKKFTLTVLGLARNEYPTLSNHVYIQLRFLKSEAKCLGMVWIGRLGTRNLGRVYVSCHPPTQQRSQMVLRAWHKKRELVRVSYSIEKQNISAASSRNPPPINLLQPLLGILL